MEPTTTLKLRSPEKLRACMDKQKSSVRKLAAAADSSPARIAQLASGKYQSTAAETALKIAAALDVEVTDLFYFPDAEALVRLGLIARQ